MSGKRPSGSAANRYACGPCRGSGTVLVDPNDRRKGEKQCDNCGGMGTVGGT